MGGRRSRSLRLRFLNVVALLLVPPIASHPSSDPIIHPSPSRPSWRRPTNKKLLLDDPRARRPHDDEGQSLTSPSSSSSSGSGDCPNDHNNDNLGGGQEESQVDQSRWARALLSRSSSSTDHRGRNGWSPHNRGRNLFRWVRSGGIDGIGEESSGWEDDASDGRLASVHIQRWRRRRDPTNNYGDDDSTWEVEEVEENATDAAARGFVQRLGWLVAMQSFVTFLTANSNHVLFEVMSQLLSEETAVAIRKIRDILVKAYDDGLADVFTRNRPADLWASIYAFSRLQNASFRYDALHGALRDQSLPIDPEKDGELLSDLARYAVYANAAYGSMMDVAFGGGLHLRDNLQNLLLRTRTPRGDVIAVHQDAKRHPAYFLLRDRVRRRIVLCLRGTWTAHDVLNDLCCEADDLRVPAPPSYFGGRRASRIVRAHHGMLLAAKAIQEELQAVLEAEFQERPEYSLVLVGHSMGGGVAALLGSLWEPTFPRTIVFAFGAPCVTSIQDKTRSVPVVSVLHELDPFSRMSLGHVADVSIGIARMCEDTKLRDEVIARTSRPFDEMPLMDLQWCSETMSRLRSAHLTSEKLYPPGRILLLASERPRASRPPWSRRRNRPVLELREVPAEYFHDLLIRPRIFDLTRHAPASYIHWLKQVADRSKQP